MVKKKKCWAEGKDAWTNEKGKVIALSQVPRFGKVRRARQGGWKVWGIKSKTIYKYKSQARKRAKNYMEKYDIC